MVADVDRNFRAINAKYVLCRNEGTIVLNQVWTKTTHAIYQGLENFGFALFLYI